MAVSGPAAPGAAEAVRSARPVWTAPAHLDRGYDSHRTRELLNEINFDAQIARRSGPAPVQVGKRWVVERTSSWMNGFGKIRRCTDCNTKLIDFYLCLYLAAAIVTVRQLIHRARSHCRWDTQPTTRRHR